MTKPFIAARIPQNIGDHLEAHCKKEGVGKTDVIINALAQYLGCSIENPIETNAVDRLTTLERKVAELEKAIQTNSKEEEEKSENISDNESDKKRVTQLSLDEAPSDNITDNETEITLTLPMPEVCKLTGISRNVLNYKAKTNKLPYSLNGHTILRKVGKGKTATGTTATLWELQKSDNKSDKKL